MGWLVRLYSFQGRTNRLTYFGITTVIALIALTEMVVLKRVNAQPATALRLLEQAGLASAAIVLIDWPILAVSVRRIRDVESSITVSVISFVILMAMPLLATLFGHWLPILGVLGKISSLLMGAFATMLLFRPGRPSSLDDDPDRLDAIFNEVQAAAAPPAQPKPKTGWAFSKPQAPTPAVRRAAAPSSLAPRTQFGLRR